MPSDDDTEALKADVSWRYVQGLQLVLLIVVLVMLAIFVKNDSPKFYVTQKNDEKAKDAIS